MNFNETMAHATQTRDRLAAYMALKQLSLPQLAQAIPISLKTITDFLKERRTLQYRTLVKINKFLGEEDK